MFALVDEPTLQARAQAYPQTLRHGWPARCKGALPTFFAKRTRIYADRSPSTDWIQNFNKKTANFPPHCTIAWVCSAHWASHVVQRYTRLRLSFWRVASSLWFSALRKRVTRILPQNKQLTLPPYMTPHRKFHSLFFRRWLQGVLTLLAGLTCKLCPRGSRFDATTALEEAAARAAKAQAAAEESQKAAEKVRKKRILLIHIPLPSGSALGIQLVNIHSTAQPSLVYECYSLYKQWKANHKEPPLETFRSFNKLH